MAEGRHQACCLVQPRIIHEGKDTNRLKEKEVSHAKRKHRGARKYKKDIAHQSFPCNNAVTTYHLQPKHDVSHHTHSARKIRTTEPALCTHVS